MILRPGNVVVVTFPEGTPDLRPLIEDMVQRHADVVAKVGQPQPGKVDRANLVPVEEQIVIVKIPMHRPPYPRFRAEARHKLCYALLRGDDDRMLLRWEQGSVECGP